MSKTDLKLCGVIILCAGITSGNALGDWKIDDNVLAHRLYSEGQYGEAAEIFTDPAWKGLALYRSQQWWRAAEAFVRAEDPISAFNLGNCYVQLGYYALALDAYQRALAAQPDMQVAQHNADLMRTLLSADEEAAQQGGRRDPRDEIDQLETDNDDEPPGGGAGGDQNAQADTGSDGDRSSPESAEQPDNASGDADDTGDGDAQNEQQGNNDPGASVAGQSESSAQAMQATGNSEADSANPDADVVGQRADVEQSQATEQWLNQIQHDPARYLQKRIALEVRRRQAAGQTPPAGGDGW